MTYYNLYFKVEFFDNKMGTMINPETTGINGDCLEQIGM